MYFVPHLGQRRALTRLRQWAAHFVRGGTDSLARDFQPPDTPTEPWKERLKGRHLDYGRNVAALPLSFVAEQLRPGLSPPGFGSSIDLVSELGE